jgi:beta-lactamase regulating signal transducer with metallopeptidase domain
MPTFPAEAFGGLTVRLVWLGLIHSLWIGLLAASVAALVGQSAPRLSHRRRHAILVAAMSVAALGPIALALWRHLAPRPEDGIAATGSLPAFVVRTDRPEIAGSDPPSAISNAASASPASFLAFAGRVPIRFIDATGKVRPVACGVWSMAVAVLGATLVLGTVGLGRLCRSAEPAAISLQDRSRRLARLLRLRKLPRILVHTRIAEPFLCGVFRPTILLPERWAGSAPPRALDAILAHELAHARRRDQVVNLAQRIVEVGLFFHPAIHWLSRSLRRERELCADALAVRLSADRRTQDA